jgi:hypothetical protein
MKVATMVKVATMKLTTKSTKGVMTKSLTTSGFLKQPPMDHYSTLMFRQERPPWNLQKKAEMKELNWPTNFWIPQVTADGRLFYLSTQTGESAMEPIEESPKTVADVPSERADGTGNSGIDKRKVNSAISKIPILGWC